MLNIYAVNNLNYNHLHYFWAVCREGGFSKAASKLKISQSAVSIQVAKLEDALGEKLFERRPHGHTRTEAGDWVFAQAEEIFRQGDALMSYFQGNETKTKVRIGALGGISKNLQLRIFSPLTSDPMVELHLEAGDAPALLEKLLSHKLDTFLTDSPLRHPDAQQFVQKEIAHEPMCLVCKKKSASTAGLLKRLQKHGIYLPSEASPVSTALIDRLVSECGSFPIRGYIDDTALLRLIALESDALIAVPRVGVHRDLEMKNLFVCREFLNIRQRYYLIYRPEGRRSELIRKLQPIKVRAALTKS